MKPTVYVVLDIETTFREQLAFDVAWSTIDRNGKEYGNGSYLISEVIKKDVPFYKDKWPQYTEDLAFGKIELISIRELKKVFNAHINQLADSGHKVVLCAYNARFDFTHLPKTYNLFTEDQETDFIEREFDIMCIWDLWGQSVPKSYDAGYTASGKFLSTSAESAYRWEMQQFDFEEMHIAWHDVEIEKEILLCALKRKKRRPIVQNKDNLRSDVWRQINIRCNVI
jgi:hypothetical protein